MEAKMPENRFSKKIGIISKGEIYLGGDQFDDFVNSRRWEKGEI